MGLFSFFRKRKHLEVKNEDFTFQSDFKRHFIGDLFSVGLPVEWITLDKDGFHAKNKDGKLQLSITCYQRKGNNEAKIDSQFFKDLKLKLYNRLVDEIEYVPYDDLKTSESFISKSFKADEETQYHYTTARNVDGSIVIIDIILREIGDYNMTRQPLLLTIGHSIKVL